MAQPGFIDHVGIGVPDLAAAKEYYDGLMSVLGLREWFETGPEGPLNYGPDGQEFPQYGEHCFATYWLDPHGFKLEAVCHAPEES